MRSVRTGANWITLQVCQLGTGEKGNFVFDLKHFWDALQTFQTFWDFCGCWGRVSVDETVNKEIMLDNY